MFVEFQNQLFAKDEIAHVQCVANIVYIRLKGDPTPFTFRYRSGALAEEAYNALKKTLLK